MVYGWRMLCCCTVLRKFFSTLNNLLNKRKIFAFVSLKQFLFSILLQCDEVVLEKTEVIDELIERISDEIDKETEKFAHMKENYIAENTEQRDADLSTFLTELKTWVQPKQF